MDNKLKQTILKTIQNSRFKDEIISVSLFGSCASNQENSESDIDLLVNFDPQANVGFFKLAQIKRSLEKSLNRKVDLVTPEALSPYFKQTVLDKAEKIYELR